MHWSVLVMLFSWTVFNNALICQICAFVIFLRVAAAEGDLNISQIYTVTFGETAKLPWPRSDRESFQDFRFYRAWKNNISFAILRKGSQTADCSQDGLQKFCSTKTEFKFWNDTILMLEIKDTKLDDEGKYTVQHVFRQMEGNHRDEILLEVKDLSNTSSGSSSVQSVIVGASTTALPSHHTSVLSTTSSVSSSVQSVVVGASTTALPIHHTSELSTTMSGPSGHASSGGISVIILGRPSILLFVLLFIL